MADILFSGKFFMLLKLAFNLLTQALYKDKENLVQIDEIHCHLQILDFRNMRIYVLRH
jgi:hypothetical protein